MTPFPMDFSRPVFDIRYVSKHTADLWMARYHYLGDSPPASDAIGLFAPDLFAIVVIGLPNNASGISGRFELGDWSGNLEINRVAKHPAANVATSRVVRLAVRFLGRDRGVSWVFSYADPKQGHHGGIYQALGAVYVGISPACNGWRKISTGEVLHPRTAVSLYGSQNTIDMNARGYEKVPAAFGGLHTYILPLGSDATAIRSHLAKFELSYPKRAPAASSDAADIQSDEGGSQPTPALQLWDVA